MKAISVPLLWGLTAICAHCAVLRLPVPPQQHKSWRPDPAIPTNILSAAEKLYEQGFPDPRGCEYREIEVEVSGVWDSKASLAKTRGWVLPGKSGTNRFAICWNALIYPVRTISTPVNLHAEVTNLFRQTIVTNKVNGTNLVIEWVVPPGLSWRNNSASGESVTVFITNALSTRLLLLLHSGETGAAVTNWASNPQMRFRGFDASGRPVANNDPYLEFAGDWAWAMFDRMISAHQRGDEALALATAQQLVEVQPKIEAECARRGFSRQPYFDSSRQGQEQPHLNFLGQLPQIIADLERRAKERAKINVIEAGITNSPDQAKRITALIDNLDLVSTRQWSQPGWVNLTEDPIVSALIQEGDAAVEPLLNCLENDQRLTRSVGFGRDFFRGRTVIPVHDAAKVALLSILRAGFNDDAPEIRAYWDKYKNLKLEDRWYAILNDDSASARWGEAAANIVQPENVRRFPGGWSLEKAVPTNTPIRMNGEILRAKSNPSVSDLMARRALEVPTNTPNAYDLSSACQMALYLAAWDPAAALPAARDISHRARTVMQYSNQKLGPSIAKLAMVRAKAGDPEAFDDYAAWIVTATPEELDFSFSDCLKPLQDFSTNQLLQTAAEKIFGDANSDWSRLPWKGAHGNDALGLNLVHVPAFRLLLIRELEKTNICGSFTWSGSGQLSYAITNYQSGSYGAISFPAGEQPANGAGSEMRWCDWIAFSLSNNKQIPFFNPFAPVEKRDAAIAEARKMLETARQSGATGVNKP